ncbi:MAG: DUF5635 domain-containing protein [Acidimicrobiia bacterium]|nr:DUF5635 domain-containing protein [Acidimicrobiia bacterium]
MVSDMLSLGRPEPEITELAGPSVRVSLLGGDPDSEMITFLADLVPAAAAADLDIVLLVDHLTRHGFVDVASAAPVLQRPAGEAAAALERARSTKVKADPVIVPVNGVPDGHPPAYRLSDEARARLPGRSEAHPVRSPRPNDPRLGPAPRSGVLDRGSGPRWSRVVRSGQILTQLEERGELAPGKEVKVGRGFFYIPANPIG